MQNFRRLRVWRDAIELARVTYVLTRGFPVQERFGLVSQMRRAAVSISSNIAEGAGRAGSREFAYHVSVAAGSLSELDSQMELACRLGFIDQAAAAEFYSRVIELRTGLYRLEQTIRR